MMEYYRIVVDAWRMFKHFMPGVENSERFFAAVLEAADKVTGKHQRHKEFCTALLLMFVEELRRIAEQEKTT